MENAFIYLGVTFLFTWLVTFSFSLGSIIYDELVHLGNSMVPQCNGVLNKISGALQRLLTFLHL